MIRQLDRLGILFATALGLVVLASLSAPVARTEPLGAKNTPHPIEGRADCLACHKEGGSRPVPSSHAGRPTATCLSCHPLDAPASTVPQASPTPGQPASQRTAPTARPRQGNQIQGNMACLVCHQREMSLTFDNGEQLSLYVDPDVYNNSVHGGKLGCVDCHASISGYPHPKTTTASRRDYLTAQYEMCKRCHFANYTKTLDSVHYQVFSMGEKNAPVCTDCHTAHAVARPNEPRTKISDACGRCHTSVYQDYAASVHGWALLDEGNRDVPVCTTCHGVHNIHSASSVSFHLNSTDLCAKCHSNRNLMDKYGISANVLTTYLDDFHGKTVNFARQTSRTVWSNKPVCTDCHGVHDIKRTDDPDSPTIKANLLKTCQKCHPDATQNFSAAWLSHYEPSLQKASLVYLVKVYYWVLIPVMIGGLVLHILLDLWRLARNR